MARVAGLLIALFGLALVQVAGVMAFHRGGVHPGDLASIAWLQRIGAGSLRGDAKPWLGAGVIGAFLVVVGLVKIVRGEPRPSGPPAAGPPR